MVQHRKPRDGNISHVKVKRTVVQPTCKARQVGPPEGERHGNYNTVATT
jgi:hypothetical protein